MIFLYENKRKAIIWYVPFFPRSISNFGQLNGVDKAGERGERYNMISVLDLS